MSRTILEKQLTDWFYALPDVGNMTKRHHDQMISIIREHEQQSTSQDTVYLQKCADSDIKANEWIGIDLDGTLADYSSGWRAWNDIGPPLQPMLDRVKEMLAANKRVKIFTARVCFDTDVCRATGQGFSREDMAKVIQDWCEKHGLPRLEVTNIKDIYMRELWDDRAVQMVPNTGRTLTDEHLAESMAASGKAVS